MAKRKKASVRIDIDRLSRQIFEVRGNRVMLDSDLAALYGVTTIRLNEQVSRNRDRFPIDFAYQLTVKEFRDLISQFAISSSQLPDNKELTNLRSQTATSSSNSPSEDHGGRRKLPWVFTEHGVAMLSSVLRSPRAVQVNIEIVRAFVRLRRLLAAPGELVEQLQQLAKTVDLHDGQIRAITNVLQQMMAPQPDAAEKKRIGFHAEGAATK
jgi:hypothetical protein